MIDKILIEKKLRNIELLLKELKSVKIDSFEEFKENVIVKRFIERNLELAIEQMVDICKHFISGLDLEEPETYADCFDIISKGGVIAKKSTSIFKSMVRFRNILIHAYNGIDDSITYGIFNKHLEDFRKFINQIKDYLKKE